MGRETQVVSCDKCSELFSVEAKEKKHSRGITEVYFVCPHCKYKTVAYFTNGQIRRKQGQIRDMFYQKDMKVRQLINDKRNEEVPKFIDTIDKEIAAFKQEIGRDMDKLREEWQLDRLS